MRIDTSSYFAASDLRDLQAGAIVADEICFLITPIRASGTEEYEHFRALRDTVIEPALQTLGYDVQRADDITQGGAITADIIRRLASARLVVADLTDLNPNVFYELGVRHALRKLGTILIVDKTRSEIPFDLRPYRVIEFSTDLRGIETLRTMLTDYARASLSYEMTDVTDSPVHDFLPSLPFNVFEWAAESHEGELREEIARLNSQLRRYAPIDASERRSQMDDVLNAALLKARKRELPSDLVDRARAGAQAEDKVAFLEAVTQLVSDRDWKTVDVANWLALAQDARDLGLPSTVEIFLIERVIELRPADESFKTRRIQILAHAEDPELRHEARSEFLSYFAIEFSDDGQAASIGREMQLLDIGTIAVMLDAYRNDGLHHQSLAITTALLELFPQDSVILRNHGRSLRSNMRNDEALDYYIKAVHAPNANDTTAVWAATTFSALERRIDALELRALACFLDADDASLWTGLADDIADELIPMQRTDAVGRRLPEGISQSTVELCLEAAFMCRNIAQSQVFDAAGTLRRIDTQLTVEALAQMRNGGSNVDSPSEFVALGARRQLAQRIHRTLLSGLTAVGDDHAREDGSLDPNGSA